MLRKKIFGLKLRYFPPLPAAMRPHIRAVVLVTSICTSGAKAITRNIYFKVILADRTNGRAYATAFRPSVVVSNVIYCG